MANPTSSNSEGCHSFSVTSLPKFLQLLYSHFTLNSKPNPFKEIRTEILAICSIYLIMDCNFSNSFSITSLLLIAIMLALLLDKASDKLTKPLQGIFVGLLITLMIGGTKPHNLRLYASQLILISTNNVFLAAVMEILAFCSIIFFEHPDSTISTFLYSVANLLMLFVVRRVIPSNHVELEKLRALKDSLEEQVQRLQSQLEDNLSFYRKFILNLSKEFRNPLNIVMGNVDLLNKRLSDADFSTVEQLRMARLGCENLLNSLNNVLDYSKVESNQLDIHYVSTNVRKTIEKCWNFSVEFLKQKGLTGELYLHKNTPTLLMIDPGRVHQIILNLVQSSAKITKQGCIKLVISWHPVTNSQDDLFDSEPINNQPNCLVLKDQRTVINKRNMTNSAVKHLEIERSSSVNDELADYCEPGDVFSFSQSMDYFKLDMKNHKLPKGKHQKIYNPDDQHLGYLKIQLLDSSSGVPNNILSTLFHKFSDFPPDLNQSVAEGGLSLWITRKVCQKMEGDIKVLSEPGKGSTFIAFINAEISPQSIGTPTPSPYQQLERRSNLMSMSLKLLNTSSQVSGTPSTVKATECAKKEEDVHLTAMVVDALPYNRQLNKQFLEASGVEVKYVASNGLEAFNEIAKYKKCPYDIIFMDINMPVMDGKSSSERIREFQKQNKQNPVIIVIVTDNCTREELSQCIDKKGSIRANYFYRKPLTLVDCQHLMRLIKREKTKKTSIITQNLNIFSNHTLIYEKDLFQQVLLENYMKVGQLKYKTSSRENILKHFANSPDNVNAILFNCEGEEADAVKFAQDVRSVMDGKSLKKIPLFGILDKNDAEKIQRLKKVGFKDFLIKPFDYENVAQLLSYPMVQAQSSFDNS